MNSANRFSTANTAGSTRSTAAVVPAAEYLTFRLGEEEYGIDILKVQEIRSYEQPTRMAQAPDFIKGAIPISVVSTSIPGKPKKRGG